MTEDSLRGQLLLDGGKLRGSFFHRSVVLICQHDSEGAFGLILNRSTENAIGDVVIEDLPESIQEEPLYLGGPVQPGALSYLHSDSFIPAANVITNVNLGHSVEELADVAASYSPEKQLRIFAGYAGWSAGQLDDEMASDSWLTHPATKEIIFETPAKSMWSEVMKQKNWQQRILADSPEDPSWN